MAKRVTIIEEVPESEKKWRGATFFTAVSDTEGNADKLLAKLEKKYLKDLSKQYRKEVKDV